MKFQFFPLSDFQKTFFLIFHFETFELLTSAESCGLPPLNLPSADQKSAGLQRNVKKLKLKTKLKCTQNVRNIIYQLKLAGEKKIKDIRGQQEIHELFSVSSKKIYDGGSKVVFLKFS